VFSALKDKNNNNNNRKDKEEVLKVLQVIDN